MASQADLEASIDALIADQAQFITDVQAEVAKLQAIAQPTPTDFQPLVDKLNAAKVAVDAADASTQPAAAPVAVGAAPDPTA